MDEATRAILNTWELEDLIPIFHENQINEEALRLLTPDEVKEMVPIIGPRVKLLKNLQEYKSLINMDVILESDCSTISVDDVAASSPGASSTSSEKEDIPEAIFDPDFERKPDLYKDCKFYGSTTLEMVFRPSYKLNLDKFLECSTTGRLVLATYKKNKILDRKTRQILVDLLVNHFISTETNLPLKNDDFKNLSEKIQRLFPNEHPETYYIPPERPKDNKYNKSINSKGKLVDKYRNKIRKYKDMGWETTASSTSELDTDHTSREEAAASALWLKNNSEPWTDVISHWEVSYPLRKSSPAKTVPEFLKDWPILKCSLGYTLIEKDFCKTYQESEMALLSNSKQFFTDICTKISYNRRGPLDEILTQINLDMTENSRVLLYLQAIPFILPPPGRLRLKKIHYKPSIQECQLSIIQHVKIPGDIELTVSQRREKLETLHLPNLPYVLVEGPSIFELNAFYVIVDDLLYKVNTCLKAVDLCFKCFHVLNCEYPAESEHIWLLLQLYVYKFKTQFDKKIPAVSAAISQLQC